MSLTDPIVSQEEIEAFQEEQDFTIPARREDVKADPEPDPEPESQDDEEIELEEPEEEPVVNPTVTAEDPGEFEPNDYSFEVVTYDEEGKKPQITNIKSIEDWDNLLSKEPNFGSGSALLKAQRLATKMETGFERDKREYDAKKKAFDEEQAKVQQQTEALTTMENEINYLAQRGDLPPVPKGLENADWSDPEVAKQSGIKERISLLNHMKRENNARAKSGLKPMTSVLDAYNSWQRQESKSKAEQSRKQAGEARRTAGAKVASSSPSPMGSKPSGLSVGRGGSLDDLL